MTGAAGFVGRAVIRHLGEHGCEVVPLTRSHVNLLDRERLDRWADGLHVDAVVHLAAFSKTRQSAADPAYTWAVNVGGTANLLAAVSARHVVFASTSAVYGGGYSGPLSEDLRPDPGSPYAASKAAAEVLLRQHAATGACGATVLRLFNVTGGWGQIRDPDRTRILNNALATAAGLQPHVTINGDGSARRDFVHVHDVAEAVWRALDWATPVGDCRVLNIGSGVGVSMAELVRMVETVTGRPVPVEHHPAVAEPQTLVADVTAAGDWLGWRARLPLAAIVGDAWTSLTDRIGVR